MTFRSEEGARELLLAEMFSLTFHHRLTKGGVSIYVVTAKCESFGIHGSETVRVIRRK